MNDNPDKIDLDNIDIDTLVADREAFNNFVYTPLGEAMLELEKRQKDDKLKKYINRSFFIKHLVSTIFNPHYCCSKSSFFKRIFTD